MNDVTRTVREVQEIAYAVSPEGVRHALTTWLCDEHNGAFTPDTTITLHEDGSATVATPFEKEEA